MLDGTGVGGFFEGYTSAEATEAKLIRDLMMRTLIIQDHVIHFYQLQAFDWVNVVSALKADPDHVKTWQYYGLWQLEQGNRDQAHYHLNKIAQLTGTGSEESRSLAEAMEKPPGTGLVY